MQEDPIKVLHVEDDDDEVFLVREGVSDAGASDIALDHAGTLETALDKLAKEAFDAILLDLSLPDSSGIEGVSPVVEAAGEAPVIVCTGLNDETVGKDAIRAGAQDYLVKNPQLYRTLPRVIRYAVERNRLLVANRDGGIPAGVKEGQNGRARIHALWMALCAVVATIVALFSNYAWQDYRRGMAEAENETQHTAAILSEQLGGTFGEVMLLLESVNQEIGFTRRLPFSVPDENLQLVLEAKFLRLPQLEAVAVLDAGGKPVLEAGDWEQAAEGVNLPAMYAQMRYQSGAGIVITSPFKHGDDGMWRIALVQRRASSRGEFEGAIVAVIDPIFFRESLASESTLAHAELTFLKAGSVVLALGRASGHAATGALGDGTLFANDVTTGQHGTVEVVLSSGTDPWIISYRRLPEGGLIVGAGIKRESVVDAWLHHRIRDAVIGGGSLAVILGLFVYAFLQIEQRLRAERAAQTAEAHLAEGIESLSEGFILFDKDDRLAVFNSQLGEIYRGMDDVLQNGAQRTAILKAAVERGVYRNVRPTDAARWVEDRADEPRPLHGLSEHLLATGRWVQVSEHRTEEGGSIAIHTDITERKQREAVLEAAKVAAEQANKAKSEFLAMISHELRTPLNAIIGFSELMKMEALGPIGEEKYKAYAADINDSGAHLLEIINDILDLSKAESGQLELHAEILDIHDAVESCVRIVRQKASDAGIVIGQSKENEGMTLFADRRALKQILFNLLSNAIKFSPEGGHIEVRLTLDECGDLRLEVADEGIGIDGDDIPRVLTPFQQVDSALSREFEGTGLGLPLVKHLAEMHGGGIEIDSTVGVGTTVSVRFPAERVNPKSAADASQAEAG